MPSTVQPSPSACSRRGSATTRPLASRWRRDDVGHLGVGGHRGVGHQRPGRRRPDQECGLARERTRGEREAYVDRRVDDRLVALGQLVVGQAGAAAGAVGRDAMVLDEQSLVPDLLEGPPHGLDVGRVHRPVGLREVDPVAHPLGHLGEGVDVAYDALAAAGVELGDAVRLDLALDPEAELLLHGQLDGQAVAVPAGLARDVVALHRPVAREQVLEDARLDVVGARHAVGGRRALVEHPRLAALGLLQAALRTRRARPRTPARRGRGPAGRPARGRWHRSGGTSATAGPPGLVVSGGTSTRLRLDPRYHPPWVRWCCTPLASACRRF